MKAVFVVAFMLVAGAFARSAVKHSVKETGPACPIDDPLVSESGLLNVTLEPILVINHGGERGLMTVLGLSTLFYDYEIQELLLTAKVKLDLGSLDIKTTYSNVVGWIDVTPIRQETLPSGDFEGKGSASLTATNIHADLSATLLINIIGNKVTVRVLTLNAFTFDSFSMDLGQDYLLNGAPIDWATLSANFKANFEADLANSKTEIVEKIRVAANTVIGQYTLAELIELIGNIGGGDGGDGGEGCATVRPALH